MAPSMETAIVQVTKKMSPLIKIFTLTFLARLFLWAYNCWFTYYELLPETLRNREIFKWSLKIYFSINQKGR